MCNVLDSFVACVDGVPLPRSAYYKDICTISAMCACVIICIYTYRIHIAICITSMYASMHIPIYIYICAHTHTHSHNIWVILGSLGACAARSIGTPAAPQSPSDQPPGALFTLK